MFKSILRSKAVQFTLTWLLAGYMALIKRATFWKYEGREHAEAIWARSDGVILCIFHGRFLVAHSGWPKHAQPPQVLISQSNDGDFISSAVEKLGLGTIRGSTRREGSDKDRGGTGALKQMVRHLRKNGCVVITPDGPRGPRMRCGEGAVRLAKMTGAPLLPYALSIRHSKVFRSWDRFMFPFPFGRGAFVWGEPVHIARDADDAAVEAARALFEARMIAVQMHADELAGKAVVQPADTPKVARVNDAAASDEPA